jgi:hypothetical protein
MVYGRGRRPSGRGGAGLGFRGSAPSWPYVGRGRGGLPRCHYPGAATSLRSAPAAPRTAQTSGDPELDLLKEQAVAIKRELDRVEAQIHDLEGNK